MMHTRKCQLRDTVDMIMLIENMREAHKPTQLQHPTYRQLLSLDLQALYLNCHMTDIVLSSDVVYDLVQNHVSISLRLNDNMAGQ